MGPQRPIPCTQALRWYFQPLSEIYVWTEPLRSDLSGLGNSQCTYLYHLYDLVPKTWHGLSQKRNETIESFIDIIFYF